MLAMTHRKPAGTSNNVLLWLKEMETRDSLEPDPQHTPPMEGENVALQSNEQMEDHADNVATRRTNPQAGPLHQPTQVALARQGSENDSEDINLLSVTSTLLKTWKFITGVPLASAVVVAAISLLIPPKYTVTTSFVPEQESNDANLPSNLAGLALQFGIGRSGNSKSPEFYVKVLGSRTLKDRVLKTSFSDPRTDALNDTSALMDILGIEGDTEAERLENGRRKIDQVVSINVDNETTIVSLSVETRYPLLSAQMANLFVQLLNHFNLQTRQSSALERRRFIEDRVADAGSELLEAENSLKEFLEQNRQFEGSPELTFQYERLQRQVRIKEGVLITLRQQYEQARIQEVDDTPLITVIDRAIPPVQKSSPRRGRNVLVTFFATGILAVIAVFAWESINRSHLPEEEHQELLARWRNLKADLRAAFLWPTRR